MFCLTSPGQQNPCQSLAFYEMVPGSNVALVLTVFSDERDLPSGEWLHGKRNAPLHGDSSAGHDLQLKVFGYVNV